MTNDDRGVKSLGCLVTVLTLFLAGVALINLSGRTIVIDTTITGALGQWILEVAIPGLFFSMTFVLGITLGLAATFLFFYWILGAAENAVTGLALRLEDSRKNKRDEYDAYYDARLADPEQEINIAYYEDDASHRSAEQ